MTKDWTPMDWAVDAALLQCPMEESRTGGLAHLITYDVLYQMVQAAIATYLNQMGNRVAADGGMVFVEEDEAAK
ncbi:MAG: hypothetical protein JWP29_1932 [Rhodoferax sp.]|nr:hypothetical protein [Rhodoferax sp.]